MIKKFDLLLDQIGKWGIVFCVFFMLSLSLTSIMLRWFEISILWIEPLVRHLVFVAGFLGGSLATGASQHIKIDLLSRLLEKWEMGGLKKVLDSLVLIVTFVACAILVKASYELALVEFQYGRPQFLEIHSGYLLSIIPAGVGIIALRVFSQLMLRLKG